MNEDQTTEWKETWKDDFLKVLCGFANAEGGTLVIGRDDAGNPVGVRNVAKLLEDDKDKLRIWNPGHLPDGWTLAKLLGAHSSKPFNPEIAGAFFRAGEIEAWGRGVQRIFSACKDADTPEPRIEYEAGDMSMEFPFSENYLAALATETDHQREATRGKVTEQVTEQVRRLLPLLAEQPLSAQELMKSLLLLHRPSFLYTYLQPGIASGLLEYTIPDKPSSRLQKYRITQAGRDWLARQSRS